MTQVESVLLETDQRGVATVTLNRPEVHNAFGAELIGRLSAILQQLQDDPNVRVMILAARGKSFSAGADLTWMKSMAAFSYAENLADAQCLASLLFALKTLRVPTIARVHGAAFGGAVGLIACCDMAIGSKLSKFCLSEVKLGLIPATISPYVIEAMGARAARRYFMTAEVFSARRARRLGLLCEAVTEEELDSSIEALVSAILKNSPLAVSQAKALVTQVAGKPVDQALIDHTCKAIAHIRVSEEGQEGLRAFLQKRPPQWIKSHS